MNKGLEENDLVYTCTCDKCNYKKALEIIKREPFAFASLTLFLKDFNTYEEWEKINPNCLTKEEYELLKEVLL